MRRRLIPASPAAAALALLLAAAPPARSEPPPGPYAAMDVARIHLDARRERNGISMPLKIADAVESGDVLRTGINARVGLQMSAVGLLTLGGDTALRVHQIKPISPPARMNLALLVLDAGAIRVDTRPKAELPPADVRLNVGPLKLRIFGAHVWAERGTLADEVCLIGGAVELQTPSGPQRLDQPGSCLQWMDGEVRRLEPRQAGSLAPRLARTAFLSATPSTLPPAGHAPGPQAATPAPQQAAPTTAAGKPRPKQDRTNQARQDQAAAGAPVWTVVLASLPERARAETEAARLRQLELDTEVVAMPLASGKIVYRVIAGRYATKQQASNERDRIRGLRGLGAAWVAVRP
ncbi:MAG: SPOR domain-containing protein [Nevskiales bacterium]|nr:SPOR domain-containing protein [Nevskiales bacterium]